MEVGIIRRILKQAKRWHIVADDIKPPSEQTIMAIAGHVSRKMLERYSHIRMEAKRAALEALTGRKPEGYGTVGDSIPVYTDLSSMNIIDRVLKKLEVATVPE